MKVLRAIAMAFSMYSRLPVPEVEWNQESRSWALCFFPLVGAVVGAALLLWNQLSVYLELGDVLTGVVFTLLPLVITGGIHMDGFCDTCDALASHQNRERKLEILSDSHVGAFAVLGCLMYLLMNFGLWCQLDRSRPADMATLFMLPVFSRILSAYAAMSQPNARGSGLLADFTQGEVGSRKRLLAVYGIIVAGVMLCLGTGAVCLAVALAAYWYYLHMAKREFGGLTGDLAGWFLQVCELAGLAGLVLAQRLVEELR